MRDDVSRIRTLIGDGRTDAEIMLILRAEEEADSDLGWTNPKRTFKALAATMRRAVLENRSVGAVEVLRQLALLRVLWDEAAASGDLDKVEGGVLQLLDEVVHAASASQAYAKLFNDMTWLAARPHMLSKHDQATRMTVERRYSRIVNSLPVICVARAASAVADASLFFFSTVGQEERYRAQFTPDVLRPTVDLLIVERLTWSELLRDADLSMLTQQDGYENNE